VTQFFRSVITSISLWWNRLLGRQPEETMPVVEVSRDPGLRCPECATHIRVTIADLLYVGSVVCPTCHLVLEVDKERSHGAIDALAKLEAAHEQARAISNGLRA